MSILVINSSPNHTGNTVALANQLLAGRDHDILHLNDYLLTQLGQSSPYDQFEQVFNQFDAADTVVLGTPIYWHDMAGSLKLFVDRLSEDVDWSTAHFQGKKLVLIAQGAMPGRKILISINNVFSNLAARTGMSYLGLVSTEKDIRKIQKNFKILTRLKNKTFYLP